MAYLDHQGTRLHVQTLGAPLGTAPAAPVLAAGHGATQARSAVVMIHGLLLGNLATWYFGAAAELAKSRSVLLYDLRGHGLSGKAVAGYDLATMVDDLEFLIDAHALDQVALVGHSYGALIALHYALRHPEKVSRLVLVEGPLPPSRGLEIAEFQSRDPATMLHALPDELQQIIGDGSRQAHKLLARLHFLLAETDLLACLQAEDDVADAQLAGLAMPVQLIYGQKSQLADAALRLQRLLPEAQLAWLDGGHYLPSEMPVALGQKIGEFFP